MFDVDAIEGELGEGTDTDKSSDQPDAKDAKDSKSSTDNNTDKSTDDKSTDDKSSEKDKSDSSGDETELERVQKHAKEMRDKLAQSGDDKQALENKVAELTGQVAALTATRGKSDDGDDDGDTGSASDPRIDMLVEAVKGLAQAGANQTVLAQLTQNGIPDESSQVIAQLMQSGDDAKRVAGMELYFQERLAKTLQDADSSKQKEDVKKTAANGASGNGQSKAKQLTVEQVAKHIAGKKTQQERDTALDLAISKAPDDDTKLKLITAFNNEMRAAA